MEGQVRRYLPVPTHEHSISIKWSLTLAQAGGFDI